MVLCLLGARAATLPAQDAGERPRIVRKLAFQGNSAIADERLAAAIATTNTGFFGRVWWLRWTGIGERRTLNELELARDVLRLKVLYRLSGYPRVRVDTLVRRTERDAYITFRIREGEPVRLTELRVEGLDSVAPRVRTAALRDLPLHEGDVFDRLLLTATADTIARRLRDRGYPLPRLFRDFSSDTARLVATARLTVRTGEPVAIGPLRVEGARRTSPATVRRLAGLAPGQPWSETAIFRAQGQLYRSDLFRYARISADSLPADTVPGTIPLLIGVTDAPPRRATASAGYGTNDCFRGGAGVAFRDFLGGGQVLSLSGRVAKVGVAQGADLGLADNICSLLRPDTIGSSRLNYNVTLDLRRPGVFGAGTAVTVSAFTERRSQFDVFRREETGVSLALEREAGLLGVPLALRYTLSTGATTASDANFCAFFNACSPDVLDLQRVRRRLATVSLTAARIAVANPLDPVRGSTLSVELTHAAPWLGGDPLFRFTRLVADASWYAQLDRDVVLALHGRAGAIVSGSRIDPRVGAASDVAFIPLEQRFFAGGPNDVRGFRLNQLGPLAYVTRQSALDAAGGDPALLPADSVSVAASGGNTLLVGNVELRFPAPVFRGRLRLAAFLDVGTVWQRGDPVGTARLGTTPGLGLRVPTPIGPARFDMAWNPNRLSSGALYAVEPDGDLVLVGPYAPDRGRTFPTTRSFPTFHVAVGVPF